MKIEDLAIDGWHRVVHAQDESSGLNAIVSVDDITLGPACGGCRVFPYPTFEEGLRDANRLARGMSYKNALGGIPFGGGKSVIFADPRNPNAERAKTPEMMKAMGRFINELGGIYYSAEDSGMTSDDIAILAEQTKFVAGIDSGGKGGTPAPFTARGVWRGMQSAAKHKLHTDDFRDLRVSIVGVGAVGMRLVEYLHEAGAKIYVADINQQALKFAAENYGAQIVDLDKIETIETDIFSPCALGGAINRQNIDKLTAKIVAGAANNQLNVVEMDQALRDRDILYAPDFVINAAGVISIGLEILNTWDEEVLNDKIDRIGITATQIFERSERENKPTGQIADEMAIEVIQAGKQ